MNKDLYSNKEFYDLTGRLNQEIKRRGGYKWFDPLSEPKIGIDKSHPLSIPDNEIQIDDTTYTVNNPSEGSIERTRNIDYPAHGLNPGGITPERNYTGPNTSAAQLNSDELRNLLVGLSKIQDINLFYGRDEVPFTAFRDPNGIEDLLSKAEDDQLNALLDESDIDSSKEDPNKGTPDHRNLSTLSEPYVISYPIEDGRYVMPSGESDGEELIKGEGLGVTNFYDDYGAPPGNGHFHPYNRYTSPVANRDKHNQDNQRNEIVTRVRPGGVRSDIRFSNNPRNPEEGDSYPSREVYGGKEGTCNNVCTGLCFMTCDNECSESCSSTCWNRCGEACTSSCGNSCTGCTSQCHSSCKTKCENHTGYACVNAGAKAVKITTTGGKNGEPGENHIEVTTYSCTGCSFSCQFYPNKKTECWDAGCMGKCYTSCNTACSTSCSGGCINNKEENANSSSYVTGKGTGCSDGCTLNCVGICSGVCVGACTITCYHACKSTCSDNCSYECSTGCGEGCSNGCRNGCTGCTNDCTGDCKNNSESRTCVGCGSIGGCTSQCQFDCGKNCMESGCKSMCGVGNAGACESNCRLNCTATSCTAMCSDACSSQCSACVNTCGFQCGACTSTCSVGCGAECNITCTEECSNSCSTNCVHSCSEFCGGCSNLCYSCIGKCIGVCSVKCENGCSNCTGECSWWCDSSCNRNCFASCETFCLFNCVGSCSTRLQSDTTMTEGPEREPTANGYIYPHPKNRWEERESFKLTRDIRPYKKPEVPKKEWPILIRTNDEYNFEVIGPEGLKYVYKASTLVSGVYQVLENGDIFIDDDMLDGIVPINKPNLDGTESLFFIILLYNENIPIKDEDIGVEVPFGFNRLAPPFHRNDRGDVIVTIARVRPEYFPGEDEYDKWHEDFHK